MISSTSPEALLTNARITTPEGVLDSGWVLIRDGLIAEVGPGPRARSTVDQDLRGHWLLPGFIDIHMHGGGGHDITASPDAMRHAAAFHREHGTTTTLISLITAPIRQLEQQLNWVATLAEDRSTPQQVLGAHLEGPFLSPTRCGAQNPEFLLTPDRQLLERLIAAAGGWLKVVTVAPELPGALQIIDDLVDAGIVAAVGHTDATYDQTMAAFDHGATLATHLFNGMRPVHHREPGPVLAALDSSARCEIINDGVHVHPAVLRAVTARGPDRMILVTDAIAATGSAPGDYQLGGQTVTVRGGQARLTATGALAGSTLTMDDAFRRAVRNQTSPTLAARAAATNAAEVLGVSHRIGAIAPGRQADLVTLDTDLALYGVMVGGRWTRGKP